MKKTIVIILLLKANLSLFSQSIEIAPKISFGANKIFSKNLSNNFNQRNSLDPDIKTWDVKQKFSFSYSLGASFQYNINEKMAMISELSYYFSKQTNTIDYFKDNLNGNGDGKKKTITSELKIKTSFLNLPIMFQYNIGSNNGIRIAGGLEFLFVNKPSLASYETKTKDTYVNNALTKTTVDVAQFSAKADVFSTFHTSLIFGIGKTFDIADKNFYIDLRYHLPISKSMLYTTDINYDNVVMKNNEVFDVWGKTSAEIDAPSYPINDFKLSIIELSFRYVLYSNK